MSEQARPWWASDGPVDGGADPTDPVEDFRRARQGEVGDPSDASEAGTDGAPPWWHAAADAAATLAEQLATTVEGHRAGARSDDRAADDGPSAADDGPGAGNARRGAGEHDDADHRAGAAGARDRAAGADDDAEGGHDGHAAGPGDVCGVCPVCTGLRALSEQRPELVDHLAEAARHLSLAVRALAPREAPREHRTARDDGLTHIDLD